MSPGSLPNPQPPAGSDGGPPLRFPATTRTSPRMTSVAPIPSRTRPSPIRSVRMEPVSDRPFRPARSLRSRPRLPPVRPAEAPVPVRAVAVGIPAVGMMMVVVVVRLDAGPVLHVPDARLQHVVDHLVGHAGLVEADDVLRVDDVDRPRAADRRDDVAGRHAVLHHLDDLHL